MKKLSIAVVEDDSDDRYFIELGLKKLEKDFIVRSFSNAMEFFAFLKTDLDLPDIILTDIRMPLVSGFDVLQKLKKEAATRSIPVFVLSTSSDEEDQQLAKELGAADYFVKPSTLEEYEDIGTRITKVSGSGTRGIFSMLQALRSWVNSWIFPIPFRGRAAAEW